jgi:hypothetical protein
MIDPRVQRLGLLIGFDDDNEGLHQFTHVCWPYPYGALCGSRYGSLGLSGTIRRIDIQSTALRASNVSIDSHDGFREARYRTASWNTAHP